MMQLYFGSLRAGTRSSTHTKDALHGAQLGQCAAHRHRVGGDCVEGELGRHGLGSVAGDDGHIHSNGRTSYEMTKAHRFPEVVAVLLEKVMFLTTPPVERRLARLSSCK